MRGIHQSPVNSSAQRPVTRSFDVFFDLHPNNWLSKQWWGWWFEALSSPLWRHCNDNAFYVNMRQRFVFHMPWWRHDKRFPRHRTLSKGGNSTSHPGIPLTKGRYRWFPSQRDLWYFLWCWPKQTVEQIVELPVISGAMSLIWCHVNCVKFVGWQRPRVVNYSRADPQFIWSTNLVITVPANDLTTNGVSGYFY